MRYPGRLSLWIVAGLLFTQPAAVHAQTETSLAAARDLYARAEYEQALQMLDTVPGEGSEGNIAVVRALCLFALNKGAAAESTIEAMVLEDPLFQPKSDDLPPRVRTAIASVRKRVLPTVVQRLYAEAKGAYDRKEFPAAKIAFTKVMTALNDGDLAPLESHPGLADLKTLASGFLDLSTAAVAAAAPPPPPVVVAAPPVAAPPRFYSTEDTQVVAPRAVRQTLPAFRGQVTSQRAGVVEVIINEQGEVEQALMRIAVNPLYDRQVIEAAKGWRYEPATLNGKPVKFLKRIQVNLVPAS